MNDTIGIFHSFIYRIDFLSNDPEIKINQMNTNNKKNPTKVFQRKFSFSFCVAKKEMKCQQFNFHFLF